MLVVRIETGGRSGIDVPDALHVVCRRRLTCRIVLDVRGGELTALEVAQDLFRLPTELHAQMIDEMEMPTVTQLRIERELRIGGPAPNQGAPRVIAHPADDGRADARRADHRMRLSGMGPQSLLELEKRGPWEADHLAGIVNEMQP